jgi:hypothetical protein
MPSISRSGSAKTSSSCRSPTSSRSDGLDHISNTALTCNLAGNALLILSALSVARGDASPGEVRHSHDVNRVTADDDRILWKLGKGSVVVVFSVEGLVLLPPLILFAVGAELFANGSS